MNLTDPAELKALLLRHGLRPTKQWGQHFLVSPKVVEAILTRITDPTLDRPRSALEVGPGPGVLTTGLSDRVDHVVAVEVDPIAVSALSESAPRATVHHADALRIDLRSLLVDLPEPRVLVSNMPYNITGPLLARFAAIRDLYQRAVLMMQLEVGRKILAQAGNSEMGSLSIAMQTQFEIRKVIDAPAGAFFPPPKVESIVLEFIPRPAEPDEEEFLGFVRQGFSQPRKTLANNLRGRLDPGRLEGLGLSPTVRPHQIDRETWQKLYNECR